jgi:hypothetical protein
MPPGCCALVSRSLGHARYGASSANHDARLARPPTPKTGVVVLANHSRTFAFLARLVHDGWTSEGLAIAADRETALHVDPMSGKSEVFSTPDHETPYVYFRRTPGPPEVCEAERSPIGTSRCTGSVRTEASISTRGTGGIAYTLSAEDGVLTSSRGEVY